MDTPQPAFSAPYDRHVEAIRPEWIDYNGHLNVAYYVLVFDNATDALFEAMDFGAAWRRRSGRSFFAVEAHVRYLAELTLGDEVCVATQILAVDDKRLHYFHALRHKTTGTLSATMEMLSLHVDLGRRQAVPFAPDDRARIAGFAAAHAGLPIPDGAGRAVGLRRAAQPR
ncbi:MAG: thioesterase family protein [Telmatospirillum sp.]|nr:thioesterase family protein [Telmatospirillum sp.]